jgi:hypothetical protein
MKKMILRLSITIIVIMLGVLFAAPLPIGACAFTDIRVEFGECNNLRTTTIVANSEWVTGGYTLTVYKFEGPDKVLKHSWTGAINTDPWSNTFTVDLSAGDYAAYFFVGTSCKEVEYFKVEKCPAKTDYSPSGFIKSFFENILGRTPTSAEQQAWIERYNDGWTAGDIIADFILGEEGQAMLSDYTDGEFLAFLYDALFGRDYDTDGYNAWMARMTGGMTWEQVLMGFLESEEFAGLCGEYNVTP